MLILWIFEMVKNMNHLSYWPVILVYSFCFISFAALSTYYSERKPGKKEAKKKEVVNILVEFKNITQPKTPKILDLGHENIELREDILSHLKNVMRQDRIIIIDHEISLGFKKNAPTVKDRVQYYLNEQLNVDAIIRLN